MESLYLRVIAVEVVGAAVEAAPAAMFMCAGWRG